MATIKIIQRTKSLSNGLYPIYLRITKDRKSKFISLNLSCEKSQWNDTKEEFRKNYSNYKSLNNALVQIKNRAESIFTESISNGEDITLDEFEALFLEYKKDKKISVNVFWEDYIQDLLKSGRTGNARFNKDSKISFFKFYKSKILYFKDITAELLTQYEVYLRTNNNSNSGIAVKMRALRALYNHAIVKGYAKKENYPFDNYKISKLKGGNNKRALSLDSIKKITEMNITQYPNLVDTKNYFLFSYYTGGMNFYDMMNLQWNDVKEDRIVYIRRKTKGNFTIKILPPVRNILDYYKAQDRKTKYVFPILLKEGLTLYR
ncbi:site-specific integrase [Apibacter muscae]|uniref:site-specific integrase n=1 Tax=Apibacter muscae TaxID=2509004 RepID=UPI0011ABEAAF|nr:site-specific integrase [Apibacter muscae]TWP22478.1 site-specific integrase [Apibacter muscae]